MTSRIAQWTLDVQDLGRPDGITCLRPPTGGETSGWLRPSARPKQGKNRNHLDLRAPDPAAEVERVLGLGGTWVDVRQTGDELFVVLADPEGNEFCIVR